MMVFKAKEHDVIAQRERLGIMCKDYMVTNGNLALDSKSVIEVLKRATAREDTVLLFQMDDDKMVGMLLGFVSCGLFEPITNATVEAWWVSSGERSDAFGLLKEFEKWALAKNADKLYCHISVPFIQERWDKVMARKGFSKSFCVYSKEANS